jgi:hypothetical protein
MPDEPGPRPQPSAEDLFSTRPSASPAEVRDELRRAMGQDVPRPPRPPDHPDVHQLAEELGLDGPGWNAVSDQIAAAADWWPGEPGVVD